MPKSKQVTQKAYEWDKSNTSYYSLKLNNRTDADIIAALDGKAKQTEIKRLIRLGLKYEKEYM